MGYVIGKEPEEEKEGFVKLCEDLSPE